MKMKRILSFICVLALALSLCSVFSFATAPEAETEVVEAEEDARAGVHYVVNKSSTYMYNRASISSGYKYNFPFPVGTHMTKAGNTSVVGFLYMTCTYNGNTYTGYVLTDHLTEVQ